VGKRTETAIINEGEIALQIAETIIRASAPTSDGIAVWEDLIENIPGVTRLTARDYSLLSALLQTHPNEDSYLSSPTYYLFTGRKGLWRYTSVDGDVLFCWHPNKSGHVLVFPPSDPACFQAIRSLLQVLPQPPSGLSLARVKSGDALSNIAGTMGASLHRSIKFTPVCETVLDWRFPVRILSTALVKRAAGNKFRNVRKGLIHMQPHDVRAEKLDINIHAQDVNILLHRWASAVSTTKEEYAELYETYDSLFGLTRNNTCSVEGLVFYVDGKIEAASLWDISQCPPKTANLFGNFGSINIKGLADFVMVYICGYLSDKGIDFLNLGGSEIPSLDFFKSKFRPTTSIDLMSIDIKLSDAPVLTGQNESSNAKTNYA